MLPTILAIETATDACSVALNVGDKYYSRLEIIPQAHSKLLLAMIQSVCSEAGIELSAVTAIAFGKGPGSFTGLRIAAAAAQGLAFGLQKPVIAVSSLQALAQQAGSESSVSQILAIIDARMQEVYWGVYQFDNAGIAQPVTPDQLQNPATIILPENELFLAIGTGAKEYRTLLSANNPNIQFDTSILYPQATAVLEIAMQKYLAGESMDASEARPAYIRNNVVQVGKKNPD